MLMVLAHHAGWSKAPIRLSLILPQSPTSSFIFFVAFFFAISSSHVSGQMLRNGQLFTNGLSIVDAPAPDSTFHFGSDIPIAIDVAGDGQLPLSASVPGNSGQNGYDGLDLYLVSSQTNTNVTVSFDSDILKQEPGSTVKHLNWQIPSCIPSGEYNLTLYECARIDGEFYYIITPIPINIDNPSLSGPCTSDANPLQDQPQVSSPPQQSPFLPPIDQPDPEQPNTPTSSGFVTSVYPSSTPDAITVTLSFGAQMPSYNPYRFTTTSNGQTITVTKSATPTTVTVVVVSTEVFTSTQSGETSAYTTTGTSSTTTTAVINGPSDTSGFVPINAGSSNRSIPFSWLLGLLIITNLVTSCQTFNL